jgi:hypothetical protein
MRRRLQQMSGAYQIVSPVDVPDVRQYLLALSVPTNSGAVQAVHEYITREQARMWLIAYDLLPKDTVRDGWGRPGEPLHQCSVYFCH